MAIDTRNKRFSLLGLALASVSVLPNPDGNIDTAGERQQYAWLYSGIDAGNPVTLPDVIRTVSQRQTPARHTFMQTPQRHSAITTPRRWTRRN